MNYSCLLCFKKFNSKNNRIPIHKTLNNKFHYICYNCSLCNNITECPDCKDKVYLHFNYLIHIDIYEFCKTSTLNILPKQKIY